MTTNYLQQAAYIARFFELQRVAMDYLDIFEKNIFLYDGMLIETGGAFGKGKLSGDKYEYKCLDIAQKYMKTGGKKESLLEIIDKYIVQYENATYWKFYHLEMAFLNSLKGKILLL